VYNADEIALMYRHIHQRRMVNQIQQETNAKKTLQRLTVTICVNAAGTHCMPPQVSIKSSGRKDGRTPRPQSPTNVDLRQLGELYYRNANA